MRDIFVTLVVFGSLPLILWQPFYGIIMWTWLGYMNPHRMAWGFSTTMPFAMMVAVTTLVALLVSKESKKIPWTRETVVLLLFVLWMCLTTAFAFNPAVAAEQLDKVLKIQFMTFVTLILLTQRERIHAIVWTVALSLGFYGIKGGIFTLVTAGAFRVQGPPGTFIAGNNELGLALLMTIPLMRYLQLEESRHWRGGDAVARCAGRPGGDGVDVHLEEPETADHHAARGGGGAVGSRLHARDLVGSHGHDQQLRRRRLGHGAHRGLDFRNADRHVEFHGWGL